MHMHNWYHSNVTSILYIHGHNCNVQLYMVHSPCFVSPCSFPFVSPSGPSLLTWNPPSCDRIRPPRSQVACKLTSPVPTLCPNPPPSKFPEPQLPSALLRRPQDQSGVFSPEQKQLLKTCFLSNTVVFSRMASVQSISSLQKKIQLS